MFLPIEIERITEDIRREVEICGAELIEIQYRRSGGRGCLTILVDKAGGISLEDCALINRSLGTLLESKSSDPEGGLGVLRSAYYLEVNSPCLDRPLKVQRDFEKASGDAIKIVWRESDGRVLDMQGRLVEVSGGVLKVERQPVGKKASQEPVVVEIPLSAVVRAARDVKI